MLQRARGSALLSDVFWNGYFSEDAPRWRGISVFWFAEMLPLCGLGALELLGHFG
jgi:hypothetical protein